MTFSTEQLNQLYAGNPVIDLAESAIRGAGADTRAQAVDALTIWEHADQLTEREHSAVLARFER